ncbi:MAG TPA: tripartite tricarboxylate transporter substrate binding protein [Burkholderiales bacterium]|nr:tripartite tricarboxylate transporter substrate binding protein [Burkholderiales bacterium]
MSRIRLVLLPLLAMWAPLACAQGYPARPVRAIVSYPAGGLPDTMARVAFHRVSETLGQTFVVDNRPGAGGITACELVANGAPDGYTLLVADTPQTAVNLALYAKLPYDTLRDFAPVAIIGTSTQFLVASAALPASSLTELIALARAKPGQLRFGSSGVGSLQHLGLEALKSGLALDIVHVPYKGTAQAVPAMLAGEVTLVFSAFPSILQFVKAGRVRLLAVNTLKRSPYAPDVPTVAEVTGLRDFDYPPVIGVLAPSRTPPPLVTRVSRAISAAVQHAEVRSRFNTLGIDPVGSTPEAYARQIGEDIVKYAKVVKAAGVRVDQ